MKSLDQSLRRIDQTPNFKKKPLKPSECSKLLLLLSRYKDTYNDLERLCLPKALKQQVFENAHDKRIHGGIQRTYERIFEGVYMRHLSRRLKRYILHCPECQLNQTKRHHPYGDMKPISKPPLIFPYDHDRLYSRSAITRERAQCHDDSDRYIFQASDHDSR